MNKQYAGNKKHWNEIQFFTETGAVLKIRVFELAINCRAEFQAYESGRRHVESQMGSNRALERGYCKALKYCHICSECMYASAKIIEKYCY